MFLLFEYLVTEYDLTHGDIYLSIPSPAVGEGILMSKIVKKWKIHHGHIFCVINIKANFPLASSFSWRYELRIPYFVLRWFLFYKQKLKTPLPSPQKRDYG